MQNENVVIKKLTSITILAKVECKIFQYNHFSQILFMQYVKPLKG